MVASTVAVRTILAAAALVACSKAAERTPPAANSAAVPTASAGTAPADTVGIVTRADQSRIRGDSAARVWVVMVSDFQCPYCRQWHDEVFPTIVREYVDTRKIRMAYVHLPLSSHQHALESAEASMCAGVQGRFWEMHDAIFRTQGRWSRMEEPRALFDSLAASVGVQPAPYRACVQSNATRPMVLADARRVADAGATVTPTFFIGNERVEGAMPLPEFRAALDRALGTTR
jgi:protein-disulfide isomerase